MKIIVLSERRRRKKKPSLLLKIQWSNSLEILHRLYLLHIVFSDNIQRENLAIKYGTYHAS